MKNLDVFISGETIDLCIPTREFARDSQWYSWFNQPSITRFLEQRIFPNTPEEQENFFVSNLQKRLLFIIATKNHQYKGVISLSSLDFVRGSCEIAIVVDASIEPRLSPYASLEAIARLTEHGFESIGMHRIVAGQHTGLVRWQQRMELLGYKLEGIHCKKFSKAHEVADVVSIACLNEDFILIKRNRGAFWDSLENMKKRIKKLPEANFQDHMTEFFSTVRSEYYQSVFKL